MSLNTFSEKIVIGNNNIIFDRQLFDRSSIDLFDPKILHRKKLVTAIASGRGDAIFFKYQRQEWVLRHYRRGGLIANINSDLYFGFNLETSRAWREFQLLAQMYSYGLPVPRPVAARTIMKKITYKADLITVCIPDSNPLGKVLKNRQLQKEVWYSIGACLRRFHNYGVYHADLNAQNILIGHDNKVYLIDFDRCSMKRSTWWKKSNLSRLKRSLEKIRSKSVQFYYCPSDWSSLCHGYDRGESDTRSL